MARHQHAIFIEGVSAQHHLEFTLAEGATAEAVAAALLATRLTGADPRSNGGANVVVGFGPDAWHLVSGEETPADLVDFPGYANPSGDPVAPATQRDVWVWVHGPSTDVVYDAARQGAAAWASLATMELDLQCFAYRDSRDLIGFVDGTANPGLDDAPQVACIPEGTTGEGGSLAMTMRFVHDLAAFEALDVAAQEGVIGRTKPDSVELDDETMPPDSHVSRSEAADDDGTELEIYRRNVPWGTAGQQGVHFVAFSPDIARFDIQMRQMYGLTDDGIVDRLLRFTAADTGSFWYCPSVEALERIAPLPEDD